MPALIARLKDHGCTADPDKLTYFIGMEKIVRRKDGAGLPRWLRAIFGAMLRNSARATDYLRVPSDQLVDLGRQIAI